ncbi:hypothetical protein [Listeria fleischmannii]|uniref:Uncharacterized protein n=1 Tax=Listeria fleischmannii FSL S10-1203 TaxID=1265822 RepID=W7DL44_9LIST|nr:hypothetical protein [Listeria fleischmannii]EUJ46213.1 hypothetical protein MCOL2_19159 [Listeria fleischmannii FSL S10-1203]
MQTGRLLIFTNGYQVLGSIGHTEQFSVHLNKHFNRTIGEEEKRVIFKAIFAYVETPIAERSLPKEDE